MAYIRDKNEERTGYQTGSFPSESVDNQCDFVFDFKHIGNETLCVIGTSVRVNKLAACGGEISAELYGAGHFRAYTRLRTPFPVQKAFIDGEACECSYDALSKTALVSFDSVAKPRTLALYK